MPHPMLRAHLLALGSIVAVAGWVSESGGLTGGFLDDQPSALGEAGSYTVRRALGERGNETIHTWCGRTAERMATPNGGCVHQIRDVMPAAMATELHALMRDAWLAKQFQYATNCVTKGGRSHRPDVGGLHSKAPPTICHCSNQKNRYPFAKAREERRGAANCKRQFSYSKFELSHDHPHHARINEVVSSDLFKASIETALGETLTTLTDWFASAFSEGDWLSTHIDSGLGHLAFVLNLTPDWHPSHGGALVFQDGGGTLPPLFNSLSVFRVGSGAITLAHRVAEVNVRNRSLIREDGELHAPRFAVTGWWTIEGGDPKAVNAGILAMEKGTH